MNDESVSFLISVARQPETERQAFVSARGQARKVSQLNGLGREVFKCLMGEKTPGAAAASWLALIKRSAKEA